MAFTSQVTGSPFTTPTNNINGIAYVNRGGVKRIYYMTATDFTQIFAMSVTGAADTSRSITLNSQGEATVYPGRGLCSDGTNLYALVGTLGSQYIHTYRLSDGGYVGTHELGFSANHYARAIETYVKPGTSDRYVVVLQDNILRAYNSSWQQQSDGSWQMPTNLGVTSGNWQSMAWDSTVDRLLINAEKSVPRPGFPGDFDDIDQVYAFQFNGTRDDRDDFRPGVDVDDMSYNPDDDDLYMVHETSTNLYVWGDFPRWKLGSANLNITEGTRYELDLKPLVDNGSTISLQSNTDAGFYDNLSLGGNGVLIWSDPPAPQGNASQQTVPLTIRATLGSNSTDQTFNFVLHAAQRAVVQPVWSQSAFPRQTVYEPYTPPAGAPTPTLAHGFTIHLQDYVAAGTPPYNFTARTDGSDFPGTFQITTRFVNQQAIRDTLVFNSRAVAASQLNRNIVVTVSNSAGSETQNLPLEVVNLEYPAWQGSTDINISDTATHSINLRDLSTGEPQTDIELVGTPDARIHANIRNGVLTLNADSLGAGGPITYPVTVKLTNILTTTDGVQRTFNVNVARQALPQSPPVWNTSQLNFNIDSGATQRIDLRTLIASANPQPTFAISNATDFTDLDGTATIAPDQHTLVVTAPNITVDLNREIHITARNAAGSVDDELTFAVKAVFPPRWSTLPHQTADPGDTWTLNLNDYVAGTPNPTIAFNPTPTGVGATATLTDGTVSWEVPNSITEDQVVTFGFRATNAHGMADVQIGVSVITEAAPVWVDADIRIRAIEGETTSYDLAEYLTAGHPTPSLHLGADAVGIDAEISFNGLVMMVRPTTNSVKTLTLMFTVVATNASGAANKQFTVAVRPAFTDTDDILLTEEDYEEIRKLIDTRLSIQDLPDEVIAADTIVGGAVAWAVDRMPIYPDTPRTLDELTSKRRAVIYRAAGILAASVRRSQDPRLTVVEIDEFQLSNSLFQKAEAEAVIAQKRFEDLGITDVAEPEIIFRVVA